MPFAIISNINERSSTRSFLDDPNERLDDCMRYCTALRPSPAALATIDAVMRRENALVPRLINWAEESTSNARLVLKWPGATSSVRAFTVEPATSVRQPRTIFFTRRDEDEPCYVDSFDPMYAALMWPLVCPDGAPPRLKGLVDSAGTVLRPAGALLDKEAKNIRQATLALMLQPERTSDGAFLLVPCQSPYGPSAPRVLRRFGRLELMGRLGDEVLVDRWLSALDARLHFVVHDHNCTTRVLLVGDPQQIPPVLPGASREEVIDASVVSLPLYHNMQHMPLTKAYRQLCPAHAALPQHAALPGWCEASAPALQRRCSTTR